MADEQQNLNVTITAQDTGASTVLVDVRARIAAIQQELNAMTAAGQGFGTSLAAGADTGAAGIARVKNESAAARSTFSELNSVGGDAARAFSALGIEGGNAAARVGALAGALGSLKEAAPELIGIVAAMTAVLSVFNAIKSSIADSGQLQSSMSQLGQEVRNQGGDWAALSVVVKNFADEQERTTIFSNTQVIQSMNRLVASGLSLSDSMTVARVAEDAAAATGKSLQEVTLALIEATHGRATSLTQLGVITRQEMHDGMSFDEVLTKIEQHMGGAAQTATTTYAGALGALGASWEHLYQDVGTPFLGMLTQLVQIFNDTVRSVDDGTSSFIDFIPQVEKTAKDIGDVATELGTDLNTALVDIDNVLGGEAKDSWGVFDDALKSTLGTIDGIVKGIGEIVQAFKDVGGAGAYFGRWVNQQAANIPGGRFATEAGAVGPFAAIADMLWGGAPPMPPVGAQNQQVSDLLGVPPPFKRPNQQPPVNPRTDNNPQVGGKLGGGGGGGFEPQDVLIKPEDTTAATNALHAYNSALADVKTAETALNAVVDASSTSESLKAEHLKTLAEAYDGAKTQLASLIPLVSTEETSLISSKVAVNEKYAAYVKTTEALKGVNAAIPEHSKVSNAERDSLRGAAEAQRSAWQEYENARTSLTTLTKATEQHERQIVADTKAIQAYITAINEANKSSNDAVATAQKSWATFLTDEQTKLHDDLATFQLTNEQKVSYFAQALQQQQDLLAGNLALYKSYQQQEVDAFKSGDLAKVNDLSQTMQRMAGIIGQNYALMRQYDQEQDSAYKASLQDELNAAKAVLASEKQDVQTTLDDILTQHKSFRDELKSIFDSILKNYVSMLSEMIVKSNWFQGVAHAFGAPTLPGATTQGTASDAQLQQASQALQAAGTQGQQAATQTSQAATQTGQAATQTGQSATQLSQSAQLLDQAASRIGSGVGGSTSDATDANNPLATLSWVANVSQGTYSSPFYVAESPGGASETLQSILAAPGSAYSAIAAYNPWSQADQTAQQVANKAVAAAGVPNISVPGTGGGAYVSGAMAGYGLGNVGAQLTGGNSTFGGLGGMFGGILGVALHANPLIGMGIDLLSGIIGGLFGNHEQPWQMPDINTPGYGQFVSNMIGTYGTYNGQYVAAQGPYNVAQGGTPEGKDVFNELAALPKNLSPAIEGLASQLRALERGDTNPNALEIKSEYQGMFTLESGAVVSVQKYMQLINEFMTQAPNVIEAFKLTRTYPNMDISHLHRNAQGDEVSGGSSTTSGTSGVTVNGLAARGGGPLIHLDLSGASITGPGGLQAIIAELESLLQRAQQGQIVGTFANAYTSNIKFPWPS